MKIALAGNPNSGKTTLFNAITGKTEYVGNWPGVTVAKVEANLKRHLIKHGKHGLHGEHHRHHHGHQPGYHHRKGHRRGFMDVRVIDLPGAYSIAPYTGEEVITRDYVIDENPDVIINIVDGSSLERSLFFTTQLLELGIPVVIALNKQDIVKKHGNLVDLDLLAKELSCDVIEITAKDAIGLHELIHAVFDAANHPNKIPFTKLIENETKDIDQVRKEYVKGLVGRTTVIVRDTSLITRADKFDRIVAHPVFGLGIFFLVMLGVYSLSINGIGGWLSGWLNDNLFGEMIPNALNGFFENIGVHPMLQALIVDGAIGGVGAVIGFIPLIMVLFFCLALLEDSGYMARVAVVMDRYFKKFGLSGKSIIPMIVGSGCAIPGVMATRTIEDINERRMTTILTPFVPCGAKLPIIGLFSVVFFPDQIWVGPSMYIIAVAVIALGGLLLKKLYNWDTTNSFIIELPDYKLPSLKHATRQMFKQAKGFIYKAATIILVMNTVVWFMQAYGWNLKPVEDQSISILASAGGVIAPLLLPLGFVGWQLAAATITGFVAKENVVATIAILLSVASIDALHTTGSELTQLLNPVTGYAFLVFNLFTPPCFAAIGAMNSELKSKRWLFRALSFQIGVGYTLGLLITQIGTLIVYQEVSVGFLPAVLFLFFIMLMLFYRIRQSKKEESIEA